MNDNKWNENYELLKAYFDEFKTWPPQKAIYNDKKLGGWCWHQRIRSCVFSSRLLFYYPFDTCLDLLSKLPRPIDLPIWVLPAVHWSVHRQQGMRTEDWHTLQSAMQPRKLGPGSNGPRHDGSCSARCAAHPDSVGGIPLCVAEKRLRKSAHRRMRGPHTLPVKKQKKMTQ